jgi:hypothetical protein
LFKIFKKMYAFRKFNVDICGKKTLEKLQNLQILACLILEVSPKNFILIFIEILSRNPENDFCRNVHDLELQCGLKKY